VRDSLQTTGHNANCRSWPVYSPALQHMIVPFSANCVVPPVSQGETLKHSCSHWLSLGKFLTLLTPFLFHSHYALNHRQYHQKAPHFTRSSEQANCGLPSFSLSKLEAQMIKFDVNCIRGGFTLAPYCTDKVFFTSSSLEEVLGLAVLMCGPEPGTQVRILDEAFKKTVSCGRITLTTKRIAELYTLPAKLSAAAASAGTRFRENEHRHHESLAA
jgi:hypothetical protein